MARLHHESGRPGWLHLVLRFWWVGLLVIGGGIAAFNYLGGSRSVTDMGVGDCFNVADPNSQFVDDVTLLECTEPHQFEMFFVGDLPDGPFPSGDEVTVWLQANCFPAFADYVGIESQNSQLDLLPITPTEDGWNEGDHSVQCALTDLESPELTGSHEGRRPLADHQRSTASTRASTSAVERARTMTPSAPASCQRAHSSRGASTQGLPVIGSSLSQSSP